MSVDVTRARGVRVQPVLAVLLDANEVAILLRTSRKAVYSMIGRRQLPGVVRIGRRVLVRQDALLDWISQKSEPSSEGKRR